MHTVSTKRILLLFALGACFFLGAFVAERNEDEKITTALVHQAAKFIGLQFTEAEADSMLNDVNDNRNDYAALRKLELPNDISPATIFNPMPAGYQFPDKVNYFKAGAAPGTKLPANKDDLAWYSISQLAELLRTKQISSVELTEFFITRLKKYNGILFNTITFTEELAMEQARKADAEIKAGKYRGQLHGIPYGAKDLLAKSGYKTTWGSVPYKDQVIDHDATVIKKLEQAGAVLIAKLSLGELAMDNEWFGGKTKNPWDTGRGSSGSSAGSASALAAGCMPFAIGSETLGSIVSPSTECGVTGLRPTFGRVSKYGAMALSWSMDKLGPMARTVEDCAIVFNAIQGADAKDQSTIDAPFNYTSPAANSLKGIRIGYIKADFDRRAATKTNDSLTLAKLQELGAELVPIELPKLPIGAMTVILSSEYGAAFQQLVLTNKDDMMVRQRKSAWPNFFRSAQLVPAAEYINANRARTLLINELDKKLKGLDLYVTPSFNTNLTATNLSGHPCLVLPNGFNNNRPTSITFTGQLFGEGKLLQVAEIYQRVTDFHKKHPSLNF